MSPSPRSISPKPAPSEVRHLRALSAVSSDAELVERIMLGHPQAAAEFYDRFSGDIHRLVGRQLAFDADHDDLVHEIFIGAWQLLLHGKLREPDKLAGWLRGIAINMIYKEIRRRYVRRRFLLMGRSSSERVSPTPGAERDLLRLIYSIAGRLAPRERLAFGLRHFEQQRLADVAMAMGCSLATAKRCIARAEKRFLALSRNYHAEYPELVELLTRQELATT